MTDRSPTMLMRYSFLVLSLAMVLAASAGATTVVKLSLDDLTAQSHEVVAATCESSRTEWLGGKVYTITTHRVGVSAKGDRAAGSVIEVHTLGGRVIKPYPIEMRVEGVPTIKPGSESVLFLERYGAQRQFRRVTGLAQGCLHVITDAASGEKSVAVDPALKVLHYADPAGQSGGNRIKLPVSPAVSNSVIPADAARLNDLLERVRAIHADQTAKAAAGKGGAK